MQQDDAVVLDGRQKTLEDLCKAGPGDEVAYTAVHMGRETHRKVRIPDFGGAERKVVRVHESIIDVDANAVSERWVKAVALKAEFVAPPRTLAKSQGVAMQPPLSEGPKPTPVVLLYNKQNATDFIGAPGQSHEELWEELLQRRIRES